MMKIRILALIACSFILFSFIGQGQSQEEPVPTLVPPTLVPTIPPTTNGSSRNVSNLARIQQDGVVRIGILYSEPAFGELTIRGEVIGFDADLARAIAEAWGVEVELVQVTRQSAPEMLRANAVDMLIAAQVHRRELDTQFEFSQTYYVGQQVMLVRNSDNLNTLSELAVRPIGVVIGSETELAVQDWAQQNGYSLNIRPYLTLDAAYTALMLGEVDGIAGRHGRLRRVITHPDLVRFLDEPIIREPYAIVMPRQDIHLRNLVNRTLQYLLTEGKIEELAKTYFPDSPFSSADYIVWENIGDELPSVAASPTDYPLPTQFTLERLLTERTLRVSGLTPPSEGASLVEQRLASINQSVINAMATRWGVQVISVGGSGEEAIQAVINGQADLAAGITPNWDYANNVDFSMPYFMHGDRLLVPTNSNISGFLDLREQRWIAIPNSTPQARDRALAWAQSVNVNVEFYYTNETDLGYAILVENNANVAYGDSIILLQNLITYPEELMFTERWYSQTFNTFALPRNDIDFRLLVDYTLQELVRDGTLNQIIAPLLPPEETLNFEIWPGPRNYAGIDLGS